MCPDHLNGQLLITTSLTTSIERGRNTKKGLVDKDTVAIRNNENRTFTTGDIMNLVASYSGVPSYAKNLATTFWNDYLDGNIAARSRDRSKLLEISVSLHWRFDMEWRISINNKNMRNQPEFKELFRNLDEYPELLSQSVLAYINDVLQKNNFTVKNIEIRGGSRAGFCGFLFYMYQVSYLIFISIRRLFN